MKITYDDSEIDKELKRNEKKLTLSLNQHGQSLNHHG